jgi:hypothetical protein
MFTDVERAASVFRVEEFLNFEYGKIEAARSSETSVNISQNT